MKLHEKEEGQVILWLAFGLPLLILFAAMALDMGLIYQTKAKLSNAVDAAVLTGARNYSRGTATAQTLATDMFQANYGSASPTLVWTWCPSDSSCPTGSPISSTLKATTTVNTTFMSYLPRFAQWSLSDTGQATRNNLIMSIVLDRSGSMGCGATGDTCGGPSLQAAVPVFVGDFTNLVDHVALISFADDARVDVPITTNFNPSSNPPIDNAVAALSWNGGTFGTGAGTNPFTDTVHGPPLNLADYQNSTVTFPAGQPYVKVVVYFTDGLMNTVQDKLPCANTSGVGHPVNPTVYNFGGYDTDASGTFNFFDPTKDTTTDGDLTSLYGGTNGGQLGKGCNGSGARDFCNSNPPYNASYSCQSVTKFTSQSSSGAQVAFSRAAITADAQYRAIYTANAMKSETPVPTYIYVIGLGTSINTASTEKFLATLANDKESSASGVPGSLYGNPYNASQPDGLFLPVTDCPSVTCTSSLNRAFQTIATKILLRLSQ
jgi:Flp pilus assembly protein TadG